MIISRINGFTYANVGVYTATDGPFYAMRDFFGALTATYAKEQMGAGYPVMVLTVVTMFLASSKLSLAIIWAHPLEEKSKMR